MVTPKLCWLNPMILLAKTAKTKFFALERYGWDDHRDLSFRDAVRWRSWCIRVPRQDACMGDRRCFATDVPMKESEIRRSKYRIL